MGWRRARRPNAVARAGCLAWLLIAGASGVASAQGAGNATQTTITNMAPITTTYGGAPDILVSVARSSDSAVPPGGSVGCVLTPTAGSPTSLAPVAVSNGAATCHVPGSLRVDSYSVAANYIPDPNDTTAAFGASTSAATPMAVVPATLDITANDVTKAVGTTLTGGAGSTAFTTSGLQNGEVVGSVTITYGTGSAAGAPAATYVGSVFASAATGGSFTASNYLITYHSGDITVSSAPVPAISTTGSITVLSTSYGASSASGTFSLSGANMTAGILVTPPPGFEVSNDNALFSASVTIGAAGTISSTPVYIRLASTASAGSHSGLVALSSAGAINASMAASGSVTAAALSLTANNASKTYGQVRTFAGTEFSASGLKNGETVGSVTLSSAGAPASAGVAGSPYAILISSPTGGTFNPANYVITLLSGSLVVNPASQLIAFTTPSPGSAAPGASYDAAATADSGLPVTLTIDATSAGVCSLAGNTVTFDGPGTCTVDADQAGDANHFAAPRAQQVTSVAKHPTSTTLAATPNPAAAGALVTFTATVSGTAPGGTVTFTEGATLLGSGGLVASDPTAGSATFATSALAPGSHLIVANYGGDGGNATSASAALTVSVAAAVAVAPLPAPALSSWLLAVLAMLLVLPAWGRARRNR